MSDSKACFRAWYFFEDEEAKVKSELSPGKVFAVTFAEGARTLFRFLGERKPGSFCIKPVVRASIRCHYSVDGGAARDVSSNLLLEVDKTSGRLEYSDVRGNRFLTLTLSE